MDVGEVRRFAEGQADRPWEEMSTTEREWWRRKLEAAKERIRRTMTAKHPVRR